MDNILAALVALSSAIGQLDGTTATLTEAYFYQNHGGNEIALTTVGLQEQIQKTIENIKSSWIR